jgi:hypothetical protein
MKRTGPEAAQIAGAHPVCAAGCKKKTKKNKKTNKQMSPHEAGDPGWECRLALRREFHPQFLTRAGLT